MPKHVSYKNLSPSVYAGMVLAKSKEGIFISQHNYVLELLEETDLIGRKAIETLIEPILKLQPTSLKKW